MKVQFTPRVNDYLDELENILYDKGYFSFEERASGYVHKLIHEIMSTLPTRLHRRAPAYFQRYGIGLLYATFRFSRATTWYAFYTRHKGSDGHTVYIVRHIENNHTAARYF